MNHLVGDIMSTPVVTLHMDERLHHAAAVFADRKFHHLPVMDGARLVGILSDRDVLRASSPFVGHGAERDQDLEVMARPVHRIMTRHVITARAQDTITSAGGMMLVHTINALPVVSEHGELLGIVTSRDLLRHLLRSTT